MKKISLMIAAMLMMYATSAFANKATKEMLDQVSNVNSSWRPSVGKSIYRLHKQNKDIVVICFYDTNTHNGDEVDPERDDVQAIFVKTKEGYKLVATVFSAIDKVLTNIDLVVPQ